MGVLMSDFFAPESLSVSELNALARRVLEDNLFGLWVAGEISNLTRAASGHYYFSLKDAKAQVRCVLFKGVAAHLSAPLKEGDHIEVSGKISIYEARGEFQITVTAVRLKGLGALYEAYERLKQQLQAEGVFAPECKKSLPAHPKTVGVITSLAAAALRDVVSTLKRRHSGIRVIVYPTAVQGAGSEQQIAQAIRTANARAEADVLIVCRGGGSIEDLWSYNEEAVVRAVAESTLPIVSGVGHETDFTLTDFAADVRAPTPTGAAELVSPDQALMRRQMQQHQARLQQLMQQKYYDASQKLDWLARQLRHPKQNWQAQQQQLNSLAQQLKAAMRQQHRLVVQQVIQAAQTVMRYRPHCLPLQQNLHHQQQQLQQLWRQHWQQAQHHLHQQSALLDAVSPQHILARGYSVVTDRHGHLVRDANALSAQQTIHIRFAQGEVNAKVQKSTHDAAQGDLFGTIGT